MNYHTSDSLRLITRERLEQRTREADNERLARTSRGTAPRRRRLTLTAALTFGTDRHATQPGLQA